jgi:hypothetical protein
MSAICARGAGFGGAVGFDSGGVAPAPPLPAYAGAAATAIAPARPIVVYVVIARPSLPLPGRALCRGSDRK